MPAAAEPFVDYFRSIAGEHPDWDEYKQAMADQGKSLIRLCTFLTFRGAKPAHSARAKDHRTHPNKSR